MGAVIELGKIINDGSKAVGDVVEAGTNSVSTISEIVKETNKNIHDGIDKLEEKKKEVENNLKDINKQGKKISGRIDKSLNEFENPFPIKGGTKTRSKFSGNIYKKTKRVRFAI
jgi:predicted phage-related endonuclease